jgi:5-methylcytosine-specific restriction endonuclease McrA
MHFLRVCSEPDCPELITGEGYRCRAHQRARAREVREKSRDWNWVYSTPTWRGLRRQVKREQPWCASSGCTELSAEVDHIIAMQDGGDPFNRQNLQGLCKRHHAQKTNEEVRSRQVAG